MIKTKSTRATLEPSSAFRTSDGCVEERKMEFGRSDLSGGGHVSGIRERSSM